MEKEKEVRIEKWAIAVMLVLGILFYFVPGKWVSLESDSVAYLEQRGRQGVLPGYPAFLDFFRSIMGEEFFLNGVVIAQSLLAMICTFVFVMVLWKKFRLKGWESILLYIAAMLPFSIYLPEVGITHQIMTEGITYAIFYLFFLTVLEAAWTLKFRWYVGSLGFAFLLGMIRSQMIILQAVCIWVFLWIILKRVHQKWWRKLLILGGSFVISSLIAFGSYKLTYKVLLLDNQRIIENKDEEADNGLSGEEDASSVRNGTYWVALDEDEAASQITALVMSRGFFEADPEDVSLFEDEMMQYVFQKTYEMADENEYLYQYAKPGLYMWEDLVCDKFAALARIAIHEYDREYGNVRTRTVNNIMQELGFRILIKHFGRYLYHTVRLMMPSFIASVFFQIRPIYLLCHFVALFLYSFAVGGAVFLKKRDKNNPVVSFLLTIVMTLVVIVVATNVVFIGLQRYVVYGMGIFYCAMYLMLKELLYTKLSERSPKQWYFRV